MSNAQGWIGVDLDGTLAAYTEWRGADHIGDPIMPMVERARQWLADGRRVRILTARVSHDNSAKRILETQRARVAIEAWCLAIFGQVLPVVCEKDYGMIELYDDRAVQVEANTGRLIGHSTRGL